MRALPYHILAALLLLSACGDDPKRSGKDDPDGDVEGGDDAGDQADASYTPDPLADELCEAFNEHVEACLGDGYTEADLLDCNDPAVHLENSCFLGILRDDSKQPLLDCLAARECDETEDDCYQAVDDDIADSEAREDYEDACNNKFALCEGNFESDLCGANDRPWGIFTDSLLANLSACFHPAYACGDVEDCYADAIVNYTVTNVGNDCAP